MLKSRINKVNPKALILKNNFKCKNNLRITTEVSFFEAKNHEDKVKHMDNLKKNAERKMFRTSELRIFSGKIMPPNDL